MNKRDAKMAASARQAFFTNRRSAELCWGVAVEHASKRGFGVEDLAWVESSAGGGAFLRTAPEGARVLAFDIHPLADGIKQQDFLKLRRSDLPDGPVAFGFNPPFGVRGKLAAAFVEHGLSVLGGEFFAAIAPAVLTRWTGQRALHPSIGIAGEPVHLDGDSAFELPDGKPYSVGHCVIAVFERRGVRASRKPGEHPDFKARLVTGNHPYDGWGLLVHCAKRQNITERPPAEPGFNRGVAIYAEPEVIDRIESIDWVSRWKRDLGGSRGMPGRTPAEVVAAYCEAYGELEEGLDRQVSLW